MFPKDAKVQLFSTRFNSPLLVQKYRETIVLDEQWVPGADRLRKQLFAVITRRACIGDDFIDAFLSTHE